MKWDSVGILKKNSLEVNMDYNISFVFLLGFYQGLQKIMVFYWDYRSPQKKWRGDSIRDSRGIPKEHDELFEGFHNILRGILWGSMGFCFFFGNICSSGSITCIVLYSTSICNSLRMPCWYCKYWFINYICWTLSWTPKTQPNGVIFKASFGWVSRVQLYWHEESVPSNAVEVIRLL